MLFIAAALIVSCSKSNLEKEAIQVASSLYPDREFTIALSYDSLCTVQFMKYGKPYEMIYVIDTDGKVLTHDYCINDGRDLEWSVDGVIQETKIGYEEDMKDIDEDGLKRVIALGMGRLIAITKAVPH